MSRLGLLDAQNVRRLRDEVEQLREDGLDLLSFAPSDGNNSPRPDANSAWGALWWIAGGLVIFALMRSWLQLASLWWCEGEWQCNLCWAHVPRHQGPLWWAQVAGPWLALLLWATAEWRKSDWRIRWAGPLQDGRTLLRFVGVSLLTAFAFHGLRSDVPWWKCADLVWIALVSPVAILVLSDFLHGRKIDVLSGKGAVVASVLSPMWTYVAITSCVLVLVATLSGPQEWGVLGCWSMRQVIQRMRGHESCLPPLFPRPDDVASVDEESEEWDDGGGEAGWEGVPAAWTFGVFVPLVTLIVGLFLHVASDKFTMRLLGASAQSFSGTAVRRALTRVLRRLTALILLQVMAFVVLLTDIPWGFRWKESGEEVGTAPLLWLTTQLLATIAARTVEK